MPSCFQLIKKGETKPSILQDVDTEMWKHFEGKEPENNDRWYQSWYDIIGLGLAMGKTFDELREMYTDRPRLLEVIEYLEERYTTDAWRSFK